MTKSSLNSPAYASDMANLAQGGFNPKLRFLFKVKFTLTPDALNLAANLDGFAQESISDLTFTVKRIDLPTIDYEYDEANYYNFKTKILKSIKYSDVAFDFYDDVGNRSLNFFNLVLKLWMPISRMEDSASFDPENSGFQVTQAYSRSSSNRWLFDNNANILQNVVIEQFFMSSSGKPLLNRYTFTNPRISNFDIDGLDHDGSTTPNLIKAKFDFDALHIITDEHVSNSVIQQFSHSDIMKEGTGSGFDGAGRFKNTSSGLGAADGFGVSPLDPNDLQKAPNISPNLIEDSIKSASARDSSASVTAEGFGFGKLPSSPPPWAAKPNTSLFTSNPEDSLGNMFTGAKGVDGKGFKLNTSSVVNNFGQKPGGLGAPDGFFGGLQKEAQKKIDNFSFSDTVLAPIARNAQSVVRNEIAKLRNKPIQALQRAVQKAIPNNKFIPYSVGADLARAASGTLNSATPKIPTVLTDSAALTKNIKDLVKQPPPGG